MTSLETVYIVYRNYRDLVRIRTVTPVRFWFGECEWHEGTQWLMDALDHESPGEKVKTFAMKDILVWDVHKDHGP